MLDKQHLFADNPRLADVAIFPFVRQFAFIDKTWFDAQDWRAFIAGWRAILPQIFFLTSCQSIPSGKAGMEKRSFLRRSDAVLLGKLQPIAQQER